MNYTICSSCGQKALSVATRCPRCGLAFEEQFLSRARSRPKSSGMPLVVLIVGVVVALVGANALMRRLSVAPQGLTPPPAPAAPAVVNVPRPSVDTQPAARRDIPAASIESLASVVRAPAVVDTPVPLPRVVEPPAPVLAAAVPAPVAAGSLPTQRRYASVWTNVRAARSSTAPVLRILRPGEAVQVDSLSRGWYRVLSDGVTVGYADRRLLADAPAAASP